MLAIRQSKSPRRTGLDIGRSRAKLVSLAEEGGQIVLESVCVEAAPSPEPDTAWLHRFQTQAGHPGGSLRCNLGPAGVIMQQLSILDMPRDELKGAVRLEAEQFLPDLENMVLDYQVLGQEPRPTGEAARLTTLIVAVPRELVKQRLETLSKALKGIEALLPDGLALANALHGTGQSATGPAMVAEISQNGTNLAIVPQRDQALGPIVHYIPVGLGGLGESSGGQRGPADKRSRKVGGRERWLREMDQALSFAARKLGGGADRLLVVGEGAEQSKMLDWMADNLMIPVRRWNPLETFKPGPHCPKAARLHEIGPHTAVALGLALMKGN